MTNQPASGNSRPFPENPMSPHDKLCVAISIIQTHILASDSALIPEKMFGAWHFETSGLEFANRLMVEVLSYLPEGNA